MMALMFYNSLLQTSILTLFLAINSMNLYATATQNSHNIVKWSDVGNLQDSLPTGKETGIIWERNQNRNIKVKVENGSIVELTIDGNTIPRESFGLYPEIVQKYESMDDSSPFISIGEDEEIMNDTPESFNLFKNFSLDSLFNQDPFSIRLDSREWNFDELLKQFQDEMPGLRSFEFNADSLFNQLNLEFFNEQPWQGDGSNGSFKIYRFDDNQWQSMEDFNANGLQDNEMEGHMEGDFTGILGNHLKKDGFLIPDKENEIELSLKSMKINGEKQPSNIHEKYKRIFEDVTGNQLDKKSKIKFKVKGTPRFPSRRF
jgi:hypothetical protein